MNKAALVAYLKIEVEELEVWLAQEWIVPVRLGADPYFADPDFGDADVARARLILDLKGGFGVNDPRIDLILHLVDQLHGCRRAFEGLHNDLPKASG